MSENNCENYVEEFLTFYSQLQQSCLFYTNLAMTRMAEDSQQSAVQQHKPFPLGKAYQRVELEESDVEEEEPPPRTVTTGATTQLKLRIPVVKVAREERQADEETETVRASSSHTGRSGRKVNFAQPVSTLMLTSPIPGISRSLLPNYAGPSKHIEKERTGFTSDSEEEGSDTDVLCDYFEQIRNGDIQPGHSKTRSTCRTANGNVNGQIPENFMFQHPNYEVNGHFGTSLNDQEYEFISDIRLCGTTGSTDNLQNQQVLTDLKYLYGDCDYLRIISMEQEVDNLFAHTFNCIKA